MECKTERHDSCSQSLQNGRDEQIRTNIYETKQSVACLMTKKQSLREKTKGREGFRGPRFHQAI